MHDANPFRHLDWLLCNTTRVLKSYNARFIGNVRTQLAIAKEVVLHLEAARDNRQLASHEEDLWRLLKMKSLCLASLQRTIVRQESRILWLHKGDAPTKFFHIYANM
jgi:hypothetical protein